MPLRPLTSFFPTADELLAADLLTLGEILLVHLNRYEDRLSRRGCSIGITYSPWQQLDALLEEIIRIMK